MSGLAPKIPEIEALNLGSPREAYRAAMLLCLASRQAAALIPGGNLSPISSTRRQAREWIEAIDARLSAYSPAEALTLLTPYDYLHRLAYSAPPLPGQFTPHLLRAFSAMLSGDTAIDQYELHRHITAGIKANDRALMGAPLKWQSLQLARWHKEISLLLSEKEAEAEETESSLPKSKLKAAIPPAAILLSTDLTAFEGRNQTAFKQQIVTSFLPLIQNQVESLKKSESIKESESTKESGFIPSSISFLFHSSPYLPSSLRASLLAQLEKALQQSYLFPLERESL